MRYKGGKRYSAKIRNRTYKTNVIANLSKGDYITTVNNKYTYKMKIAPPVLKAAKKLPPKVNALSSAPIAAPIAAPVAIKAAPVAIKAAPIAIKAAPVAIKAAPIQTKKQNIVSNVSMIAPVVASANLPVVASSNVPVAASANVPAVASSNVPVAASANAIASSNVPIAEPIAEPPVIKSSNSHNVPESNSVSNNRKKENAQKMPAPVETPEKIAYDEADRVMTGSARLKTAPTMIPHKRKSRSSWFNDYFGMAEIKNPDIIREFKADPIENNLDTSLIDLRNISFKVNGQSFAVGDFSCLPFTSLKKLENRNNLIQSKLNYFYKQGDISKIINDINQTDIVVVQAASQFNLLEMADPIYTPQDGITGYAGDNTQGPQVALSSPAGTLFRNYAVWNGASQFTNQINTLITVMKEMHLELSDNKGLAPAKKGEYSYINGYLYINPETVPNNIQTIMDNQLRVGIQWNTPSILDPNNKLCQVYSSGLPFGDYIIGRIAGSLDSTYYELIKPFAVALLASTFKCTLQAGVLNALKYGGNRCTVYLTTVGGGVFLNPHPWIQEGLLRALEEFKNYPLNVIMVYYKEPQDHLYGTNIINNILWRNTGGSRTRKNRSHRRLKRTHRIRRM